MIRFEKGKEAAVLAALYNKADGASTEGRSGEAFALSVLSHAAEGTMTEEKAQAIIDRGGLDFDYLGGHALKVNLEDGCFDEWLYDRDNGGEGTARRLLGDLALEPGKET